MAPPARSAFLFRQLVVGDAEILAEAVRQRQVEILEAREIFQRDDFFLRFAGGDFQRAVDEIVPFLVAGLRAA